TNPIFRFTYQSPIEIFIHSQSSEIAQGVDSDGAGDQGMMFGYACSDTPELMPLPIVLSHQLAKQIDTVRNNKTLTYLRPDGKTQVTVLYQNSRPVKVTSVVIAVPHDEKVKLNRVNSDVFETIVTPVLGQYNFAISNKQVILNGTGIWHIGG